MQLSLCLRSRFCTTIDNIALCVCCLHSMQHSPYTQRHFNSVCAPYYFRLCALCIEMFPMALNNSLVTTIMLSGNSVSHLHSLVLGYNSCIAIIMTRK